MTVFSQEMKLGRKALIIWTGVIGFMLLICVALYPQMKNEMSAVTDMFANMGSFTAAFGMDKINFGSAIGYYGVECGSCLGIGGGLFAALLGISALAKEEKDHTAEFLLSHPVSRARIVSEKLLAVMAQIVILNLVVTAISVASFKVIGEELDVKPFLQIHAAYLLLQIQIAAVCFGFSAFMKNGGVGAGLGFAMILYFLNIIANISEGAHFLRYLTPFAYSDAATIISEGKLDIVLIAVGLCYTAAGIAAACIKYTRKDIEA